MWLLHAALWLQSEQAPSIPAWTGYLAIEDATIAFQRRIFCTQTPHRRIVKGIWKLRVNLLMPGRLRELPQVVWSLWAGIREPFAASRETNELIAGGVHDQRGILRGCREKEKALAELNQAREAGHHSAKLCGAIGHLLFELRSFRGSCEHLRRRPCGWIATMRPHTTIRAFASKS